MLIFLLLLISPPAFSQSALEKLEGITQQEAEDYPEANILSAEDKEKNTLVAEEDLIRPERRDKPKIEPEPEPEKKLEAITQKEAEDFPEADVLKEPEPQPKKKPAPKPKTEPAKKPEPKKKSKPIFTEKKAITIPIALAYTPESLHSISRYQFDKDFYVGLNVELYSEQYKGFEDYLKNYIKF